jgi:HSP20 family molecular chaperone IbpA
MFFKRGKKCASCDGEVSSDWSYCPSCGEPLKQPKQERVVPLFAGFDDIFKQMDGQMAEMGKMFGQSFKMPKVVMRPGGMSITIVSGSDQKPKVSVQTFGNAKKMEPQIKQQLGVDRTVQEVEKKPKILPKTKTTEEPEMKMKKDDENTIYTISLPGVEKKNIEIRRLPNSIEVRAVAGNKLFFKLFEAPQNLSIMDKKFENGKLTLVLA